MSTVLGVTGACKTYGETKALDGAAVSLNQGEWLALLGPNGAGKTTLIRAIAGRVKLDRGSITLLGQRLNETQGGGQPNPRERLGVVPQDVALYPLLTAEENLKAFGELNGVTGAALEERIQWALEWTGLADRAKSLSKTFSGGMKRRLNIACSVLHRPEVVLLDEPTVGVDPQSRQRIWEMLGALRDEGASLLLTTHQLDEAQQICDRIVIIDHGKSIADGTFAQLLQQTVGSTRQVLFKLKDTASKTLAAAGFELVDSNSIKRRVDDLVTDLPRILGELERSGVKVTDLQVHTPTLQSVFIHLTGRELRE
jgi:ABC-2 type transport system ATP-binding protein